MEPAHRSTLRFFLDEQLLEVADVAPTTTVLDYLRTQLGRCGTKEGCAEGDCGACTVVVADLHQGALRYRAVNACIQLLPALDGKRLYTVESLNRTQTRHPVQQALLELHASQCGFCTPGFVMSLFALYKTRPSLTRNAAVQALTGNLCRCTGYRPIVQAAQRMYELAPPDAKDPLLAPAATEHPELQAELASLQSALPLLIQHRQQRWYAPQTLEQLADYLLVHPQARLVAGSTDVGLWVTKQLRDLPHLVAVSAVAELQSIQQDAKGLSIGAAVSLEAAWQAIVHYYPSLSSLYQRFASLPVRNAGTLVGNLANGSPIGDSMPALIALGAELLLRRGALQRWVPLDAFYLAYQQQDLQPSEFIQAVRIPWPVPDLQLRCWKISKRFGQDIAALCAAFALQRDAEGRVQQIRIAFGGMAGIPQRAKHCEAALQGQAWTQATVEQAMLSLQQDFAPLSDLRASAEYRQQVAANLLWKFYLNDAALDLQEPS